MTPRLVDLIGDGRDTLSSPRGATTATPTTRRPAGRPPPRPRRTGAGLLEYPSGCGTGADPTTRPGPTLRRAAARRRRARAASARRSPPTRPRSRRSPRPPGDEVLLAPGFLAHFTGAREVFVRESTRADDALDDLHRDRADPWGVDNRWYERRKRDLTLAMLPRERFRARASRSAARPGALAADLARALRRAASPSTPARPRSPAARRPDRGPAHGVRTSAASVPDDWPRGAVRPGRRLRGRLLPQPRATRAAGRAGRDVASTRDGVVVLCHWRHAVDGLGARRARGAPAPRRTARPPPVAARRTATATSRSSCSPTAARSCRSPTA